MAKRYYKTMIRNPAILAVAGILLILSLIPLFDKNFLTLGIQASDSNRKVQLFELNYWSFFSFTAATFITMPLFAIFSQNSRMFFHNESVIVRFSDQYVYWRKRFLFLLADSAIFVVFIHLLLFIRILIFNDIKELMEYLPYILLYIPLNITGFFAFGLIDQMTYALTGNVASGFFVAYAFVFYDFFAHHMGTLPGVFVTRAVALYLNNKRANLLNLFVMLTALAAIILVFINIMVRRDCLIPKENKNNG